MQAQSTPSGGREQGSSYCDQLTSHGGLCQYKATMIVTWRDGREEAFCTRHANLHGAWRYKHRRFPR